MKRTRLSILGMMATIALIALGFAGLRTPTVLWASLIFTVTVAFLSTAILGAIARRGRARVAWAGVGVFGWAYFVLSFGPFPNQNGVTCPPFPTRILVDYLRSARESTDAAISASHSPWAPLRPDTAPHGESMLDAPRAAFWFANPLTSPRPPAMGSPPPPPPTLPKLAYLDWLDLRRIGHSLGAILFGLIGGLVGFLIAGRDRPSDGGSIPS